MMTGVISNRKLRMGRANFCTNSSALTILILQYAWGEPAEIGDRGVKRSLGNLIATVRQ